VNIFHLHNDPKTCAEMHNSKHVIKMILESCQLLSTAHRVLDGEVGLVFSKTGKAKSVLVLPDSRDTSLYSATHINHPSAIWCRQSALNYSWLHKLTVELCKEYTYRYGKVHKCFSTGLVHQLAIVPNNIIHGDFTEVTPAMPDDVKVPGNSIASYRNYYMKNKQNLASWTGKVNNREVPDWFIFE